MSSLTCSRETRLNTSSRTFSTGISLSNKTWATLRKRRALAGSSAAHSREVSPKDSGRMRCALASCAARFTVSDAVKPGERQQLSGCEPAFLAASPQAVPAQKSVLDR
jgi:hypothetical protein